VDCDLFIQANATYIQHSSSRLATFFFLFVLPSQVSLVVFAGRLFCLLFEPHTLSSLQILVPYCQTGINTR
jgi:hypothetical protein